jgi:hypothetical protein
LATPGFSRGCPMGRVHAAFGMSFPANAADAHEKRKRHAIAFIKTLFFKKPPGCSTVGTLTAPTPVWSTQGSLLK